MLFSQHCALRSSESYNTSTTFTGSQFGLFIWRAIRTSCREDLCCQQHWNLRHFSSWSSSVAMGEGLTLSPAFDKVFQLWDIAKYNQMFTHNRILLHGFQKLMVWHHKYNYSQKIPLATTENKRVLCELSNTLRWPVTPLAQVKDTTCCYNTSF